MPLTITSWNINSVRLRIDLVRRFVAETQPDVLCLQETKCPDDQFPLNAVRDMGFPHVATHGQKGYNGVAIFSRLPLTAVRRDSFGGKEDSRHIAATLSGGAADGLTIHNFYVPAGGDVADPAVNEKFAHKLAFIEHLTAWSDADKRSRRRSVLLGDLNIAPYEHDVWSHTALLHVVSHTPVETEGLERTRRAGGWVDAVRHLKPEPEKVYTWWSYRSPDWSAADKGRRLDHVWTTADLEDAISGASIARHTRGWDKPSDHAPVTLTLNL